MTRAIWFGEALTDLGKVDDFYAMLRPEHADRVTRSAIAAARFLADHPHAGPIVEENFRKWRVPGTAYLHIYRIHPDGVGILRVHHGHENWRRPKK